MWNYQSSEKHFARFGITEEIITDNGPNFVSQEFATFTNRWDIRHSMSSPYHSQGNGKAESAVKIAKQLMRKAKETKSDVYVALLDWRNTPTVNMDSSPVQRLMQKRTRTLIPTSENLLEPEVCRDVKQKQIIKRQMTKRNYDKQAHPLPQLLEGQPVYVRSQGKGQPKCMPGECHERLTDRSYTVRCEDSIYRRNRVDLKPRIIEQENVDTDEANPETTGEQSTDPKTGLPEQREQDATSPKPRSSGRVRRQTTPYIHIL